MNSPTLFPQTLLDIKVNGETVIELYRNCGLPPSLIDKLFTDLPPQALSELITITRTGLENAHEQKAKLSDLATILRYILLYLLTKV